jgi:hypothetical protein
VGLKLPRPEYGKLERVLSDEPWFEICRIRPGVFAIYEPKQFEEVISYWWLFPFAFRQTTSSFSEVTLPLRMTPRY